MEQRNLLIAIALSIAILIGFQYVWGPPAPPPVTAPSTQTGAPPVPDQADSGVPGAPSATPAVPAAPATVDRRTALAEAPRIPIRASRVHGSISLKGARLDVFTLADSLVAVDPDCPEIALLSPPGSVGAWYGEFGWVGAAGVKVPDADTVWSTDAEAVEPNKPVTLTWDNGEGLIFSRTFTLDENYLFTVTQTVENTGDAPATLYPYG